MTNSFLKIKQLMLLNTAGGITSGDDYNYHFLGNDSNLNISTQADTKIYSGFGIPANIKIDLDLTNNSNLFWLPKELILFNNCNLKRKINFNISKIPIYLYVKVLFSDERQ